MTLKLLGIIMAALLVTSCALFVPPQVEPRCKICWQPAPCQDGWIGLSKGGCMIVIDSRNKCPDEDEGAPEEP